ncbi:hypothetical protein V6N13_044020 [Hibiscus sabdariffa]
MTFASTYDGVATSSSKEQSASTFESEAVPVIAERRILCAGNIVNDHDVPVGIAHETNLPVHPSDFGLENTVLDNDGLGNTGSIVPHLEAIGRAEEGYVEVADVEGLRCFSEEPESTENVINREALRVEEPDCGSSAKPISDAAIQVPAQEPETMRNTHSMVTHRKRGSTKLVLEA